MVIREGNPVDSSVKHDSIVEPMLVTAFINAGTSVPATLKLFHLLYPIIISLLCEAVLFEKHFR